MKSGWLSATYDKEHDLLRREFLKVGAGFSAMLSCASALSVLSGCSKEAKEPAKTFTFLEESDLALFGALAPAVVLDLVNLDAAKRGQRLGEVLRAVDAKCSALDLGSRQELRKLLDLLAIAPLRYLLTGVGAWNEASIDTLQNFLGRWRGSRFATLNAGGNVLVKLAASSYYALPATWQASGYPGPLEHMYKAVNS